MAHCSLRASFVVTTVATVSLAACGGETGNDGNPATCPSAIPGSYGAAPCEAKGVSCNYPLDCQGGPIIANIFCTGAGPWRLTPQPCTQPYDSCPGTDLYCSGNTWSTPIGGNPPSPCPGTLPEEGSSCYPVGFGGVREYCGYPCASTGNWVVARCPHPSIGEYSSTWSHDQACP